AHSCFVECAGHRIALLFVQRLHLIKKRLVAFAKAVANLLHLSFLVIGQVKLATKRTKWSKAFTRSARSTRPTTKPRTHRPWRRRSRSRTLRLLRRDDCGGH